MVVSSEMTARGLKYKVTRVERGEMIGNAHERLFLPGKYVVFLFFKDKDGRTQIHHNGCQFLGQRGKHACACPLRLSYNAVDSHIGKLRSIFRAIGRDGE